MSGARRRSVTQETFVAHEPEPVQRVRAPPSQVVLGDTQGFPNETTARNEYRPWQNAERRSSLKPDDPVHVVETEDRDFVTEASHTLTAKPLPSGPHVTPRPVDQLTAGMAAASLDAVTTTQEQFRRYEGAEPPKPIYHNEELPPVSSLPEDREWKTERDHYKDLSGALKETSPQKGEHRARTLADWRRRQAEQMKHKFPSKSETSAQSAYRAHPQHRPSMSFAPPPEQYVPTQDDRDFRTEVAGSLQALPPGSVPASRHPHHRGSSLVMGPPNQVDEAPLPSSRMYGATAAAGKPSTPYQPPRDSGPLYKPMEDAGDDDAGFRPKRLWKRGPSGIPPGLPAGKPTGRFPVGAGGSSPSPRRPAVPEPAPYDYSDDPGVSSPTSYTAAAPSYAAIAAGTAHGPARSSAAASSAPQQPPASVPRLPLSSITSDYTAPAPSSSAQQQQQAPAGISSTAAAAAGAPTYYSPYSARQLGGSGSGSGEAAGVSPRRQRGAATARMLSTSSGVVLPGAGGIVGAPLSNLTSSRAAYQPFDLQVQNAVRGRSYKPQPAAPLKDDRIWVTEQRSQFGAATTASPRQFN